MASIFDLAKSKGIEDIEIYTGLSKSTSLKTFNGKSESYKISEQNVQSIRGLYNGKMGYVYTENLNDNPDELLDRLIQNASVISSNDYEEIYAGSASYPKLEDTSDKASPAYSDIMAALKNLEDSARKTSDLVSEVSVTYHESIGKVTIENSKGLKLTRDDHYFYIVGDVVCRKDELTTNTYDVIVKKSFKDFDTVTLGSKLATLAEKQMGAAPCESANYKVLLQNDAVISILQTLAGLFYADNVQKGLSPLKDKLNTQLVGENITITDDPFLKDAVTQYAFDDEGVSASTTTVVNKGKLVSYLYNLKTAHKDKVESTGNGFKGGVSAKVGTSFTNFYIQPGQPSFDEMVTQVGSGVLITDVSGTHSGINQYNGDFSLQAEGFMIEDGILGKPIKLVTIAGNIFEMLSNVDVVGGDMKNHYTGIGAPSMVINSLPVSGK